MSDPTANVRPFEIAARVHTEERSDFVRSFSGDKLVLINLDGQDPSLVRGLLECPTDQGGTWYPRSDATGTGTFVAPMADQLGLMRNAQLHNRFDGLALRKLLTVPHFVLPLRKRAEALDQDAERIRVGRSHVNDIVLYHPSVSKVHAWLEWDERGGLFVGDAGSTNFTRVEGRIIAPDELSNFELGEEVSFGEINVRLCTADMLWDALQL